MMSAQCVRIPPNVLSSHSDAHRVNTLITSVIAYAEHQLKRWKASCWDMTREEYSRAHISSTRLQRPVALITAPHKKTPVWHIFQTQKPRKHVTTFPRHNTNEIHWHTYIRITKKSKCSHAKGTSPVFFHRASQRWKASAENKPPASANNHPHNQSTLLCVRLADARVLSLIGALVCWYARQIYHLLRRHMNQERATHSLCVHSHRTSRLVISQLMAHNYQVATCLLKGDLCNYIWFSKFFKKTRWAFKRLTIKKQH